MSRSLVIVDVQSLFLGAREYAGILARMDYVRLKDLFKELEGDTTIIDKVAYILASPLHDDRRFIQFLKKNNYITIRKPAQLNRIGNGDEPALKSQSWADAMVWEAIKMLPKYDSIIIVSGNGQFNSVLSAAKQNNKRTTVVSFKASLQSTLSSSADKVVILDSKYIYDSSAMNQGV